MAHERRQNESLRVNAKRQKLVSPEKKILPPVTDEASVSNHEDFLRKLFANHPSQMCPRNQRLLVTASEMWDMSDHKKLQDGTSTPTQQMRGDCHLRRPYEVNILGKQDETIYNEDSDASTEDMNMTGIEEGSPSLKDEFEKHLRDESIKELCETSQREWKDVDHIMLDDDHPQRITGMLDRRKESAQKKPRRESFSKKIDSIEEIRSRLVSGEEIDSAEVDRIASGDLSQSVLDQISSKMQERNSPGNSYVNLPNELEPANIAQRSNFSGFPSSPELRTTSSSPLTGRVLTK